MGPEEFNYEFGRKGADAIARYLIIQKSIDPLRVVTVSYGKNKPVAENNSQQGRAKSRSTPTAAVAPKAPERDPFENLSQLLLKNYHWVDLSPAGRAPVEFASGSDVEPQRWFQKTAKSCCGL